MFLTQTTKNVLIATFFFIPMFLLAQNIPTKAITFPAGKSTAIVKNVIKGSEQIDYTVNGKSGETLKVSLKASNGSNYFNIMEPGSEYEAVFNGSMNGNTSTQKLTKTGVYKIRVYLMRNAAQRGIKSSYTLTVTK